MHKYKLQAAPEVRHDIRDAKRWYQKKNVLLPNRFMEEVKIVIAQVHQRPLSHSVRYKNVRIAHLKIFPYGGALYRRRP
ncbi:MAG: hypothetical protein QM610_10525 [Chitinophagaceae bacterium]